MPSVITLRAILVSVVAPTYLHMNKAFETMDYVMEKNNSVKMGVRHRV
jgi:hypothetical protein